MNVAGVIHRPRSYSALALASKLSINLKLNSMFILLSEESELCVVKTNGEYLECASLGYQRALATFTEYS